MKFDIHPTKSEKPMNEKDMVSRILKGEEIALKFFYTRFQSRLISFIRSKISNENDAEEVLQDTLLATIEGLRDFSFRSSLYTFIYCIANHKIIDYYRRKKIKNIVFSKIPEAEIILATILGPEDEFDDKLLREKIKKTFRIIAPDYSLILRLKYVYGYSVEEIARKLSVSFKSVESRLFRARRAFTAVYSL